MKLANRLPPPWVIEDENETKRKQERQKEHDDSVELPTPLDPIPKQTPPEESNGSDPHQVVIIDL